MAELEVKIVSDVEGGKKALRTIKDIRRAAAANDDQFRRTAATSKATAASVIKDTQLQIQTQRILTAAIARSAAALAARGTGGLLASIATGATAAITKVNALTTTLSTKLQPALRLVGLAAVAAFGFAIKSSVKFEETMSRIVGLVDLSAEAVEAFEQPLLDIAKATAKGPNELAEALFFITSAGARGTKAIKILEASAKAASAGLGNTKVVADAVTSAVNAYGEEALSAAMSTDVLTATVREGKAEADSIAQSLGRVLPIASQLGVTFDQVGATVASLTRVGLDANEATTSLRATLALINKPGKEAADTLRDLSKQNTGVALSFEDVRKTIREDGLLAGLQQVNEAVAGNAVELTKIFPNLRANAGVFSLLGKNAAIAAGIFERMKDTTGATDKAFAAFANTTSFTLKESLVAIQISFKTIADELLPAVAKAFVAVASAVEGTVGAFDALGKSIAEAISGSDDPYLRALNKQDELNTALENFSSKAKKTFVEFKDGVAVFEEVRIPLTELDKMSVGLFGANKAGVELSGTFEEQLAQLSKAAKAQDVLVQQIEKEKLGQDRINQSLREQGDIIEEIVVTATKRSIVIDTDALEEGKLALTELRGDVVLLGSDLANLQALGQTGIGLAEDANEASILFGLLQAQVDITEQEVLDLVIAKRTLTTAIDEVTEAFAKQDAANTTLEGITKNIENMRLQLAAASSAGIQGLFQEQALQQAQLIMADLGADTEFTVEQIQQLIIQEQTLKDAVGAATKELSDQTEEMTEFAKQAARNIQSAFADFLFDPFEDGLDGLARSFGETLRRMAAEVLSQQILTAFLNAIGASTGAGILNVAADAITSNASGGDFSAGETMLVGEEGPELITPKTGGTVLSNADSMKALGGGGGAAPNITVQPAPVVVVDDPRKVPEALQSAEGQRALVAAIGEKSSSVNQALGRDVGRR